MCVWGTAFQPWGTASAKALGMFEKGKEASEAGAAYPREAGKKRLQLRKGLQTELYQWGSLLALFVCLNVPFLESSFFYKMELSIAPSRMSTSPNNS